MPSARHPISQTQQASSLATATLATHLLCPDPASSPCLLARRLVQSLPRLLISAGTSHPSGSLLGLPEQLAKCHAASTSVLLEAAFPVLVMWPCDSLSPEECSEGTSPHQLAYSPADPNLEKHPASAARQKALATSMPLMVDTARTTGAHLSVAASAATAFSSSRLSASAHLAAVT